MSYTPEEEKVIKKAEWEMTVEEVVFEIVPLLIQVINKCMPLLHDHLDPKTIQKIKKVAEEDRDWKRYMKHFKRTR
jgi:hypothetical protein